MFASLLIHTATLLRLNHSGYQDGTPQKVWEEVGTYPCRISWDDGAEFIDSVSGQRAQRADARVFFNLGVFPHRGDRLSVIQGGSAPTTLLEVVHTWQADNYSGPHHVEVLVDRVVGS